MIKKERKQLRKKLEKRLLAGESKAAIYAGFDDELEADLVAVALAQIPTPERREKNKILNWLLITSLGVVFAAELTAFAVMALSGNLAGAGFALFIPAVVIFLILLVAGFRGLAYPLVVVFCLLWGVVVLLNYEKSAGFIDCVLQSVSFCGLAVSTVIAFFLKKKLLPNTHFLVMPVSDSEGKPVFED